MSRRLISTLNPEAKIGKWFYVIDIAIFLGVFLLILYTHSFFKIKWLKISYIVLTVLLAIWSIWRPKGNPFKRNYQIVKHAFQRDEQIYYMVEKTALRYSVGDDLFKQDSEALVDLRGNDVENEI